MEDLKSLFLDNDWAGRLFIDFMQHDHQEDLKHVILKKKDVINGKQLTINDLRKKMDENLKIFVDKSPWLIKNAYEYTSMTFEFYNTNSNQWEDDDSNLTEVSYNCVYAYENHKVDYFFTITVEIEE